MKSCAAWSRSTSRTTAFDRVARGSCGSTVVRTTSDLRVCIHSSSRAVLPDVLAERDVGGGRLLAGRSSGRRRRRRCPRSRAAAPASTTCRRRACPHREADRLAQGFRAGEMAVGERLVHHRHPRRRRGVALLDACGPRSRRMPSVGRSCGSTSLKSACGSLPGSGAGLPTITNGIGPHLEGQPAGDARLLDARAARARARARGRRRPRPAGVTTFMSSRCLVEVARAARAGCRRVSSVRCSKPGSSSARA